MTKTLLEVYGLGLTPNPDTAAGKRELRDTFDIDLKSNLHNGNLVGPSPFDASYRGYTDLPLPTLWQKDFYLRVRNKQDSFVSVPPAAGKTQPMMAAWFADFTKAIRDGIPENSTKFPRIVYIAKTKQLAMEALGQNFQRDSKYGLFSLISNNLAAFGFPGVEPNTPLSHEQITTIYTLIKELTGILYSGVPESETKSTKYVIKPVLISTTMGPGSSVDISKLIKKYKDYIHYVVLDEFQQYIPRPGDQLSYGEFTPEIGKDFNLMLDIISSVNKPGVCGVSILTGTVNQETSKKFCQLVDHEFGRKFNDGGLLVKFDSKRINDDGTKNEQYTANRSMVQIVPYEKMKNPKEIEETIINIVKAKQKNSVMIIFSTGRSTATGIFRMLEKVIDKLPIRNLDDRDLDYFTSFLSRKDQIEKGVGKANLQNRLADKPFKTTDFHSVNFNTDPAHKVSDEYNRSSFSSMITTNRLTKIMGTNYISPRFDKELYPDKPKPKATSDIEFLKHFDVDKSEERFTDDDDTKEYYTNEADINNLVYEGIRRGIGVMVGKSDNRMKGIIQKLFRDGKIYLVLATDAVGIGANVTCKHLYITNLEKVDTAGFGPIDSSSLIQLVNRAGRDSGKLPYAFIYTQLKDYDRVKKLFEMDPSLAVEEIPFGQIEKKIKDKRTLLQSMWRSIFP